MKTVIQRVRKATVSFGDSSRSIGKGMVVLLGINREDNDGDVLWMAEKVARLRVFNDDNGKLNLSLLDIKGEVLVVSQFTLYGDCRKGRRPDFTSAAPPDIAIPLYKKFIACLKENGLKVEEGSFGAHMLVEIQNEGPVTCIIDSKTK